MNKFNKIISSVFVTAVLLGGSVFSTGAANIKVVKSTCDSKCTATIAKGCEKFFQNFRSIDWNCILKQCGVRTCPSDCETATVPEGTTAPPSQPAEAPKPTVTEPEKPVVQPETKPAAATDFDQAYEDEVIRLVNVERSKYGLSALAKREDATAAAEIRAKEIVLSFSHTRPDGTSCFTVCKQLGITYRSVGENIAYGYRSPEQVVNGWMNSEGHRKNILSASFTSIGVGCYRQGGTLYWSQLFLG